MAYAEKRGKGPAPWRVKYKLPNGTEISESGFETKAAALTWGRDQEARIREGRWTDPNAGKLTVGEWIDRWLAIQDVGISTVDHRGYLLRRFIRPAWDETPMHSLSTEEITRWENALPARTGVSPRTARAARTLLGTILGDAATTRPPLIPYNPALRPRNRGRRTGRRLQLSPQRAWATPLETLLLAERAALLTGRAEDFTMIVTIGYTGPALGRGHRPRTRPHPPRRDLRRVAALRTQRPVPPAPAQGRLLPQPGLGAVSPCRLAAFPGRPAHPRDPGPPAPALRLRRPAWRQRPVRLPRPRRRPLPAQQLRSPRLPPRLRRPPRSQRGPTPQARHRRRHHLARCPHCRLATRGPVHWLRTAARPRHPGHPRRHTSRLLASYQANPDRARAQARPQDLDGRGRHPRDPRRTAPRPPGPRHARPLRPRLRPDARRPQARTPGPVGRLPTRPRDHQPALTRPVARRAADSRGDPPESGDTRRQGEDDLPNSSQPPRQREAAQACDTGRTGINSV